MRVNLTITAHGYGTYDPDNWPGHGDILGAAPRDIQALATPEDPEDPRATRWFLSLAPDQWEQLSDWWSLFLGESEHSGMGWNTGGATAADWVTIDAWEVDR